MRTLLLGLLVCGSALALDVATPPRNLILNSGIEFNQRVVTATTTNATYVADRFMLRLAGTPTVSAAKTSPAMDSRMTVKNAITVTTTSGAALGASDLFALVYIIPGYEYAQYNCPGCSLSMSFWVKPSVTGQHTISFQNIYGSPTRTYVATYSATAAVWNHVKLTIPTDQTLTWNTDTSSGLVIWINIACGSSFQTASPNTWASASNLKTSSTVNEVATTSNTFSITQFSLVPGKNAVPYARAGASYQDELRLLLPYYEKSYALTAAITSITNIGATRTVSFGDTSGIHYSTVRFKAPKRISTATCDIYSNVTGTVDKVHYHNSGSSGDAAALVDDQSFDGFTVNSSTYSTSAVAEQAYQWACDADY